MEHPHSFPDDGESKPRPHWTSGRAALFLAVFFRFFLFILVTAQVE